MTYAFLAAGGLMLAITLIHVFAGGPQIARPLIADNDLHPVVRYTNYYCWHLVTICLAVMSAAFLWSGSVPEAWEAAVLGTVLALGFAVWGVVLVTSKGQRFRHMPQAWFFLAVAGLGLAGFAL